MYQEASALAVLTRLGERLHQALTHALAGHLNQTKRGDLSHLVLGAVAAEALDEATQHAVAVGLEQHVHKVDDDDAADVAQAKLPHDLFGRFEVVEGHRLFERAALADELAGVDVDDRHGLGAVDAEPVSYTHLTLPTNREV